MCPSEYSSGALTSTNFSFSFSSRDLTVATPTSLSGESLRAELDENRRTKEWDHTPTKVARKAGATKAIIVAALEMFTVAANLKPSQLLHCKFVYVFVYAGETTLAEPLKRAWLSILTRRLIFREIWRRSVTESSFRPKRLVQDCELYCYKERVWVCCMHMHFAKTNLFLADWDSGD